MNTTTRRCAIHTARAFRRFAALGLVALCLTACGGGGSGGTNTAASVAGSNIVTGTMPATSVASLESPFSAASSFAWFKSWWTGSLAHAAGNGRVEVQGTDISVNPLPNGRFLLANVPDGSVTLLITTPDDTTGTLTLNLPRGGGAYIDLGHVVVHRNRTVDFHPSGSDGPFPVLLRARGPVSGLTSAVTDLPSDTSCSTTFNANGLTFCIDRDTRFEPPLHAKAFNNGDIAKIEAQPTDDATSRTFRALHIQRNSGAASANNNTVTVVAPITDLGDDTITVLGTPLITDGDANTPDLPNAHAITFDISSARFDPRALADHLSKGLLVEITTPKKNQTSPAVTLDGDRQVAFADRVRLVRVPCPPKGELVTVDGRISSIHADTKIVGLDNNTVLIHVTDGVTRFDEPLTSFSSLQIGQLVEVKAFPPQTSGGPLEAVHIELEEDQFVAIEARGKISALDTIARTFIVAGIAFAYSASTEFVDVTADTLAEGQFVEVDGTGVANGVSTALRIDRDDSPPPLASNVN